MVTPLEVTHLNSSGAHGWLPQTLPANFLDDFEKLSPEQAGHIRHFHNLASQIDGDWSLMGAQEPAQEWLDGYRYQLAIIAYATGATHYHRMPALRSVFKTLFEKLIDKMLRREVWGYWYLTSQSGIVVNPDLKELRKPWADPNKKENIMLIAMRYNDVRDGTNIVEDVLKKYTAAWKEKGMIQEDGLFVDCYRPHQDKVSEAQRIGFTAWSAAFLNSWNPSVAHAAFDSQTVGFLSRVEPDRVELNSTPVAQAIRQLVKTEGADPASLSTVAKAKDIVRTAGSQNKWPLVTPNFGYVAIWVSEVGNKSTLDGLLTHADKFMNPTWRNGGLYYPRSDHDSEKVRNETAVDPFTGNSAIGYARLNILDGQRKMWLEPWTAEQFSSSPYVDSVDLSSDVDFVRGFWDAMRKAMVVTMRSWDGEKKRVRPVFRNLEPGLYGVYLNGELIESRAVGNSDELVALQLEVDGVELDVVLLKA